jgi:hypothetical protein
VQGCVLNSSGTRQVSVDMAQVAGFSECGNNPADSIKGKEFLD